MELFCSGADTVLAPETDYSLSTVGTDILLQLILVPNKHLYPWQNQGWEFIKEKKESEQESKHARVHANTHASMQKRTRSRKHALVHANTHSYKKASTQKRTRARKHARKHANTSACLRGRVRVRVRVFLNEFFFCVDACVFAWTSACFLTFFFTFINSQPWISNSFSFATCEKNTLLFLFFSGNWETNLKIMNFSIGLVFFWGQPYACDDCHLYILLSEVTVKTDRRTGQVICRGRFASLYHLFFFYEQSPEGRGRWGRQPRSLRPADPPVRRLFARILYMQMD